MRLSANPFDLVGADIEVSEGNLALIVSDHEIGEWPLEKVAIDAEVDGFHMTVDGEKFVFTTAEADAFAAAVGISRFGARTKKSGRPRKAGKAPKTHASLVQTLATPSMSTEAPSVLDRRSKPAKPVPTSPPTVGSTTKAKKPIQSEAPQRVRSLVGRIDISTPQAKIGVALAMVAVVLAFVARPVLAGILLFIGMAGVLLVGAASVDPLLATRLPEGWPTSRLAIVAMTVIVSGLLLVAF